MKTQLIAIFVAAFSLGNFARAQQGLSCLVGYVAPLGADLAVVHKPADNEPRKHFDGNGHSGEWKGSKDHSDQFKRDPAGRWYTGTTDAPLYYVPPADSSHGEGSCHDFDGPQHCYPSLDCSSIPEPSTYAFLLGLAAFGLVVRRRFSVAT